MKKLTVITLCAVLMIFTSFQTSDSLKSNRNVSKNIIENHLVINKTQTQFSDKNPQENSEKEPKPKRTVSYNTTINAPIETVWKVLTETEKYDEWNPFVKHIEMRSGSLSVGGEMLFQVEFANGNKTKTREKIIVMNAPQNGHAIWRYRLVGFLYAIRMMTPIRTQELFAESPTVTRYESREDFSGWGSFLVPYKQVSLGFKAQAEALKARCEKMTKEGK